MKFLLFYFFIMLTLMTGCSTLPSLEVMKAEIENFQLPYQANSNSALVYVVRPSGLGGLVRFNVFVDDQEVASEMGYTRSSQYIYFNLMPGKHKIYSLAENWAEVEIEVKANEIIFLQQEPEMGIIMARNSIFRIEDYVGKFHVKKLSPGTIIKMNK